MSLATSPAPVPAAAVPGPSLARLVRVELRKATDTCSGFWLLLVIGLLAAAVAVVMLLAAEPKALTFEGFFLAAQLPVAVLLPVLGILAVTGEQAHRTALTTFCLVPQRWRVVLAKALAVVLLALLAVLATLVVAAAANLVAVAGTDGDGSWAFGGAVLGEAALLQVLTVGVGVGFGLLLLSSPLAIVLFFLLPTLFAILVSLVSALAGPAQWLDFSTATGPLLEGASMSGRQWAHLATSSAVWGLLPLVLGTLRVARHDVS